MSVILARIKNLDLKIQIAISRLGVCEKLFEVSDFYPEIVDPDENRITALDGKYRVTFDCYVIKKLRVYRRSQSKILRKGLEWVRIPVPHREYIVMWALGIQLV